MGQILGKISVETPKFDLIRSSADYEIRAYAPSVVAEITYDPAVVGGPDAGFMILASYIGAVGEPKNVVGEKISMTAPVITRSPPEKAPVTDHVAGDGGEGGSTATMQFVTGEVHNGVVGEPINNAREKISMTRSSPEKVRVTDPAAGDGGEGGSAATMQFVTGEVHNGAVSEPKNDGGEKISMIPPVLTRSPPEKVPVTDPAAGDGGEDGSAAPSTTGEIHISALGEPKNDGGEKIISMTAPVITRSPPEKAPVTDLAAGDAGEDGSPEAATMQFASGEVHIGATRSPPEKDPVTDPTAGDSGEGRSAATMQFVTGEVHIGATISPPEKAPVTDPAAGDGGKDGSPEVATMQFASGEVHIGATRSPPEKAPVTDPAAGDAGDAGSPAAVTMQFVLPAKYSRAKDAPRPADGRVRIREEGERRYGVVRFGGVATKAAAAGRAAILRRGLERDGFRVVGDFLLARYNPPWTLPPFRTNEVMLPIQ